MAATALSDRPPGWPAWCVSLLVHGSCLVAMLVWLDPTAPTGAAVEPTREIGIALKRSSEDGPRFETEEEQREAETSLAETTAQQNLLDALPRAADIPSTTAALPNLPTLGPGAREQARTGDVAEMASGGASAKRTGGHTTVSVFGLQGEGSRFVYVFDRSISMAGPPLRTAKAQLIESLSALDTIHQFQIIFFNHEPQAWDLTGGQQRIAFASDENKHHAERFVRGINATGGTFRRSALQMGLRLRPDVIFFLTDTDDPMPPRDLAEAVRRAQRGGIAIHAIEFGTGEASSGENFLVQLARETGGGYVYVDTTKLAR